VFVAAPVFGQKEKDCPAFPIRSSPLRMEAMHVSFRWVIHFTHSFLLKTGIRVIY